MRFLLIASMGMLCLQGSSRLVLAQEELPEWATDEARGLVDDLPLLETAKRDGPERGAGDARIVLHMPGDDRLLLQRPKVGSIESFEWSSTVRDKRSPTEIKKRILALAREPGNRDERGRCAVRVLLRVSEKVPWAAVREVLSVLVKPDIGMFHLQFAVRKKGADRRTYWLVEHELPWQRWVQGTLQERPADSAMLRVTVEDSLDDSANPHVSARLSGLRREEIKEPTTIELAKAVRSAGQGFVPSEGHEALAVELGAASEGVRVPAANLIVLLAELSQDKAMRTYLAQFTPWTDGAAPLEGPEETR